MAKKAEAVKKLLEKDPAMNRDKIAKKVGCHPLYVGKIKREMGLTRTYKPRYKKKKALPKATQQNSGSSNFSHHEKKVIQHLGQFDTVAKTVAGTKYSAGFIERTRKKAVVTYGSLLAAKDALCESTEVETLVSAPVSGVSAEVKTSYEKHNDLPPQPLATRANLLDIAKNHVTKDRQADHGDAENNFTRIAGYWSVHLGVPIAAHDVAVMMALLKVARIKSNPEHVDNWVDGAGYFACGGEIANLKGS